MEDITGMKHGDSGKRLKIANLEIPKTREAFIKNKILAMRNSKGMSRMGR